MRVRIVSIIFLTFFTVIIARLFYWQVWQGNSLAEAAALQRDSVQQIPAQRGQILANDGNVLVGNEPAYLLFASTVNLKISVNDLANKIAPILFAAQKDAQGQLRLNDGQILPEVNLASITSDLVAKMSSVNNFYIPLQHQLTQKYIDQIKSLNIPNLGYDPEPKRYYPEGALAATTLGFVGSNENGLPQGYSGLEGFYNGELTGHFGLEKIERDATGLPILIGTYNLDPPQDGRTIETTIDRYVQFIVEKHLAEGLQKYGAKQASAVVMDPKTGDILASVTLPAFDPRGFNFYSKDLFRDGIISDTYEPGSTFKAVTMAAGLDTGTVTSTTVCPVCDQSFSASGHDVQTWNNKYFPPGTENMTTVLEHSDNVGAAWLATKLGKTTMYSYAKSFGVGDNTGIDMQGEESGVFYPSGSVLKPIDLATLGFGQGFSLTALKIAQIYGSLANNGLMMKPRLVKEIIDNGRVINIPTTQLNQVIKPGTAQTLTSMLLDAVNNGEAKRIIPHGYRIAGKTGTAQVPIAGHYDPNKTVASFVGYGPVENPRFVMIVKYTEPTASIYAALTAEPTFFDITKDLFGYFGLAPTL